MGTLWQDMKYGIRMLLRRPGFTLLAVLTLALGLGATTAIFTVVNGVLLRPLPYPEPEQLVQVWQIGDQGQRMQFSEPNFQDLREQSRSFETLALYANGSASVTGGSEPVLTPVVLVSTDFFRAVGVQPALGRSFTAEDHRQGATAAIVSHGFWLRYLGGDPDLSKHTLRLLGQVFPVIGVMPAGLEFPPGASVWIPREVRPPNPHRTAHNWRVIGRLADGVTTEAAQQEASAIARRLKQQYGANTWMEDAAVVPLHEQITGGVRTALLVLLGAVGFLLLVACTNVANLFLARMAARRQELAVRVALGASRWRLVREFLTESLLLSLAGGAAGMLLAVWGVKLLLAFEPGNLPRTGEVVVDGRVAAFAFAASLATAAALGLIAGMHGTGHRLHESLKEGGRSQSKGGLRLRSALVAVQVALTLVLLAGAGLMARSFLRLLEQHPGFRTEGVLAMSLASPPQADVAGLKRLAQFHEALLSRLQGLPGVEQAGGINAFPLSGSMANGMFLILTGLEDQHLSFEDWTAWAKNHPDRVGQAEFRVASAGYFPAMGIPLVRGRLFEQTDGPDAPHVAVISESLAQQAFAGRDPIGQSIQFGNMDGDLRLFTIVGIVGDVRDYGLDSQPQPTFYAFYRQRPSNTVNFTVVLRGKGDLAPLMAAARSVLREMAPDVPARFQTAEEILVHSVAERRFALLLLSVFGSTALLLAAVGIYSLTAYAVQRRTQEIGIRMALGAQRGDVLRMILTQSSRLAVIGTALGLAGAIALTRYLRSLLFEVSPTDPATLAVITLLLGAVAILGSLGPAWRATQVDPLAALRYE